MKKFTKVALILATVFLVISLVCVIGAAAMGLTWGALAQVSMLW